MGAVRWFFVLAIAMPAIASGAAPRTFAVEVTPPSWRAEALATTLAADLADDRLAFRAACCSDAELRSAGVELAVRISLGASLHYELRALWPGAPPPAIGDVALGKADRIQLTGALRDRLHRFARSTGLPADTSAIELPGLGATLAVLAAIAVLLALPFARGARILRRVPAFHALRTTALILAAAGAFALALVALDAPANLAFAGGGLAWGAFAVVTLPFVFPPVPGIGRVEHDQLWRLVGAWLAAIGPRVLLVAVLYAPVVAATRLLDLDPAVRIAVVIPIALLVVRQTVRCAIAVEAEILDARLVDAARADAWSSAVRAYFVGYHRRVGLPVDAELLDRVRFLPGKTGDVAVYGGGLTPSRVVIPRHMLERALAPWGRPHDYGAPRVSTLHWQQWNAGLVMASGESEKAATREQRQPREVALEGDTTRDAVGEPPTTAGIIEPQAFDARASYRPHDDPRWLDWDPGEDYDGTDAGDLDFLFGALVHAVGQIQRHSDRIATIARAVPRAPAVPDPLEDPHTALSGARDHFVQYLAWRKTPDARTLTARAYAPQLAATTRKLAATQPDPRIARLAGETPPPTRLRRIAFATLLVAGAGVLGTGVVQAIRYHGTYVERMETTHGKAK